MGGLEEVWIFEKKKKPQYSPPRNCHICYIKTQVLNRISIYYSILQLRIGKPQFSLLNSPVSRSLWSHTQDVCQGCNLCRRIRGGEWTLTLQKWLLMFLCICQVRFQPISCSIVCSWTRDSSEYILHNIYVYVHVYEYVYVCLCMFIVNKRLP